MNSCPNCGFRYRPDSRNGKASHERACFKLPPPPAIVEHYLGGLLVQDIVALYPGASQQSVRRRITSVTDKELKRQVKERVRYNTHRKNRTLLNPKRKGAILLHLWEADGRQQCKACGILMPLTDNRSGNIVRVGTMGRCQDCTERGRTPGKRGWRMKPRNNGTKRAGRASEGVREVV